MDNNKQVDVFVCLWYHGIIKGGGGDGRGCLCSVKLRHFFPLPHSVLFHLYRRTGQFSASPLASQFDDNVITAFQDDNNNYVVAYPEQPEVIAFNLSAMMLAQDEILLPFRTTEDNADPTTLAVYLGSFASKLLPRASGMC